MRKCKSFKNGFADRASGRNWINLSNKGAKIEGVPRKTFRESFETISYELIKTIQNKKKNKLQSIQTILRTICLILKNSNWRQMKFIPT